MKLVFLSDNNGTEELNGEWGLSVYIEFEGHKLLLDAGGSELFLANAEKLGIDLAEVEFCVLLHAHWDNGNGLEAFLAANTKSSIYLQECCGPVNYAQEPDGSMRYNGVKESLYRLHEDRLVRVRGDHRLAEHIRLIPHKLPGREEIGRREHMFIRIGEEYRPDDFSHEQSLVFETEKGLVIFNSCSHAGAASIIEEVRETFPGQKVYAMIGGFHLYNKSETEVRAFARKLEKTGAERIFTGHCTGDAAYEILKETLGSRLSRFRVGLTAEL